MKKIKTTWRVFSAKRRVSIGSLAAAGKFSDYSSYLQFCEHFTVLPVSLADFVAEMPEVPGALVAEVALLQEEEVKSISDSSVSNDLEATVWLAGVKDETFSVDEKKTAKKKSKSQDQD